jgi:hypothetical protein
MTMKKPRGFDPQWAKAKRVCRLSMEDIRMAKALGMSPKSLMKNNPSPEQRWKAPVKHWVRSLYEERFGREQPMRRPQPKPTDKDRAKMDSFDDCIPF